MTGLPEELRKCRLHTCCHCQNGKHCEADDDIFNKCVYAIERYNYPGIVKDLWKGWIDDGNKGLEKIWKSWIDDEE